MTTAIVYLPSLDEAKWRTCITQAALRAGYTVMDQAQSYPAERPSGPNLLVNCYDPETVRQWAPDEIVILKSGTDQSIQAAKAIIQDPGEAVRFVSARFAQAEDLRRRGGVRVLDASETSLDLGRLGLVTWDLGPKAISQEPSCGPLCFYDALPPLPGVEADWPQQVFVVNEQNHGDLIDGLTVDLTGRRRLLQSGPAIRLTPGSWLARTRFAVAVRSSPIDLRFEWGSGHDVAVLVQTVRTSGVYEVSMEHTWETTGSAELRTWLDRAMFDGGFEFLSCHVRLIGDPGAAMSL